MARVYKAVDPDGDSWRSSSSAPDLAGEDLFRQRFSREAEPAARIEHPHLVPVLDTGEHEGVPYMAQPSIPGGTLQDKIEREGTSASRRP